MKLRRGVFALVVVFSLIFFFQQVSSYDFNVANLSLAENQVYGEPISGSFVLSLLDAPVNLIFYSTFGNISLKDFLINNGKSLPCESYNCSGVYALSDMAGAESILVDATPVEKVYGLYLIGDQVTALSFDMVVSSVFLEKNETPLNIKIGNGAPWSYDTVSEDLSNYRELNYGCFNQNSPSSDPLIDSIGYCEEVNLTSSKGYFLGANISGSDVKDLIFSLTQGGETVNSCTVSVESASYSNSVGCSVVFADKLAQGLYEVCIKTQQDGISNYKIKRENMGVNCGHYASSLNKNVDYSIFVKTPLYAASNGIINLGESFKESSVDSINEYISSRYLGSCGSGCVVPIKISGRDISLAIESIGLDYSTSSGPERNVEIYSILEDVPRMNFSEKVSMESFGWIVYSFGDKSFSVSMIGDGATNKLFNATIKSALSPIIRGIYPLNPPAGINVYFYANVDNNFSKLIWNFGDGSSIIETNTSSVKHIYQNVSKSYNITLTAYGSNSSMQKSFVLTTISPENYINSSLDSKRTRFNSVISFVNTIPILYRDFIKEKGDLINIQTQLSQIESDKAKALSSNDFLDIANKINSLNVPVSVSVSEKKEGQMDFFFSSIDPSLIAEIKRGNYTSFEEFKSPIYEWQLNNIVSSVVKNKYRLLQEDKQIVELLTVYNVKLFSKSNETSYFIIQEPQSNIHFGPGIESLSIKGQATAIEVPASGELSVDFFVEGSKEEVMFVSPQLSSLPTPIEVSVCNLNNICQKDIGENSDNCRADCKPIFTTTILIILSIVFMLVIYTVLQVWYKVRYEDFLFKDRSYLFNLLAFINNSKLNGKSRGDIFSTLESRGWSNEQTEYAVKKSEGKNTGMFEIIPVQKIVAYLEMRKAEKLRNENIAPPINGRMNNVSSKVYSKGQNINPRLQPRKNIQNNNFGNRKDIT